MNSVTLLDLLLYALAAYRLTLLFVEEGGPLGVFVRLRHFGKPFTCTWCMSVWVAMALTAFRLLAPAAADVCAFAFALSALVIGLKAVAECWQDFAIYIAGKA